MKFTICPDCGDHGYTVTICKKLGTQYKVKTCIKCNMSFSEEEITPDMANTHTDTQTRNLSPIQREMERSAEITKARQTVAQAMGALFIADEYREDCRKTYLSGGDVYARDAYKEAIDKRRKASNELIRARDALTLLKSRWRN